MNHTPGPWSVSCSLRQTVTDANGERVATIASRWGEVANGRLIAAAPEMFDALKWLLQFDPDGDGGMPDYKELRHVCDMARAAIARATGEA